MFEQVHWSLFVPRADAKSPFLDHSGTKMLFTCVKPSLRWPAPYTIFWSLTIVSASFLDELEHNWWEHGPFAEPANSINELFPSHEHPISNAASRPLQYESHAASEQSDSSRHYLPKSPSNGQNFYDGPTVSPIIDKSLASSFEEETQANEQANPRKRIKHSVGDQSFATETPPPWSFMPGSSGSDHSITSVAIDPIVSHAGEVNQRQPQALLQAQLIPHDKSGGPTVGHHPPTAQAAEEALRSIPRMKRAKSQALKSIKVNHIHVTEVAPPRTHTSRLGAQNTVPIIYEYRKAMVEKLRSDEYQLPKLPFPDENMHPRLPIGYMMKTRRGGFRLVRILNNSRTNALRWREFHSQYGCLITEIHALHLERRLNTPAEHTMHVENIFKRLNDQLLQLESGVPLMGISRPTARGWDENFSKTQWGEIQEKLAWYFSDTTRALLSSTASELIDSYCKDLENDKSAIELQLENIHQLEELNSIRMSPFFEARFDFVFNLPAGDEHFQDFLDHDGAPWIPNQPSYEVFRAISPGFSQEIRSPPQRIHRTNLRTDHAVLPIGLFVHKTDSTPDVMRVLEPIKRLPYDTEHFVSVYNHLIKSVEFLHVSILRQLKMSQEENKKRRLDVLSWVGQEIMNPKESYPVFGTIPENIDLSTLKAQMRAGHRLFGPIQLSLMKYFSSSTLSSLSYPQTTFTAAFLLTSWYEINHPIEFSNFFFNQLHCRTSEEANHMKSVYFEPCFPYGLT
ncbi:hypothetical protein Pst134EB_014192 [Puccinia striiformis f. sp. tritici]|nr:hypothetical protein Pst134EB_014192 [Puccinia striiformis f. sp. tritici]